MPAATPAPAPSVSTPVVSLDLTRLLRGNWVGALATALVALGLALGVSTGLVLASDPENTSLHDQVVFGVMGAAGAVSADAVTYGEASDDGEEITFEAAGQVAPLLITLISMGAAALVFRRVTRRYPRPGAAVADAARASAIFALGLWVLALSLRGGLGDLTDAMDVSRESVDEVTWGASAVGSLFLGFAVLFLVLLVTCFLRADWLSPRWRRGNAFLAAPIVGLALFAAVLPVAGSISYVTAAATTESDPIEDLEEDDADDGDAFALLTGSVSNFGLAYLSLGAGGRVGNSYDMTDYDEGRDAEWFRMDEAIDEMDDAWGLWFAIPTLLVLLVLVATVVARLARSRGTPAGGLLIWAGAMFLWVPLLSRLASGTGSMSFSGDGEEYTAEGYVGIKPTDSLLIPLIALAIALLLGLLTGAFSLRALSALQSSPGAPHPGPTPPSGPPPLARSQVQATPPPGWQPPPQ
jgi:hypothetical protein